MHTVTEDLSEQSQLISDLFKWPETKDEWEKYKLSKEQLEHFIGTPLAITPQAFKTCEVWRVSQIKPNLAKQGWPSHGNGSALIQSTG